MNLFSLVSLVEFLQVLIMCILLVFCFRDELSIFYSCVLVYFPLSIISLVSQYISASPPPPSQKKSFHSRNSPVYKHCYLKITPLSQLSISNCSPTSDIFQDPTHNYLNKNTKPFIFVLLFMFYNSFRESLFPHQMVQKYQKVAWKYHLTSFKGYIFPFSMGHLFN